MLRFIGDRVIEHLSLGVLGAAEQVAGAGQTGFGRACLRDLLRRQAVRPHDKAVHRRRRRLGSSEQAEEVKNKKVAVLNTIIPAGFGGGEPGWPAWPRASALVGSEPSIAPRVAAGTLVVLMIDWLAAHPPRTTPHPTSRRP